MKGFFDLEENCKEKIISEDYWDFIIPLYRDEELKEVNPENVCIQEMDFGYKSVSVDRRILLPLSFREYWYSTIPKCYALLDMQPLDAAGIITLQNYPTLQLMGDGIMIGFLDTGIDYQNRVFRNLDGTTRIVGIWDQTIQTGRTPQGLYYGTEYTEEMINAALRSEDPLQIVPSVDTDGHGTFVASAAAGGAEVGKRFLGAAPEASIAMVKLKPAKNYLKEFFVIAQDAVCYQENDIMLGLRYLNDLARKQGMPLVICVALGTSFGGHNGDSLLADILDIYATVRNRCVVVGTGNEAARRHHYFNRFTDAQDMRTAEIRVGEGTQSFAVELWSTLPNIVMVSVTSPSGERTGMIPIRLGYLFDFLFTFERTTITVEYRLLQENNDAQLVFIRFQNAVPGIWKIDIKPAMQTTGDFHIWLPMEEFLEGEVYFLESNPDTTFTEPSGGRNTMTVAFYNSRENGVDINSGRGYTRDEKIKPDYAAPGETVTGAVPGGGFKNRTGSSAATAIAAGGCALIMEWISEQPGARGVSSSQVRNIIVMGTQKLSGIEYPNTQWGYGTMNLYRSLDILRQL
ncbi:S8 family peptidase [Dorea longicatena]|uniref:S8 family peptidase n=2 Tax=Lachnospiraceae TaxID=186803 RepID=UPI00156E425B|nr:S8 family peptidase [Dorea longicatena]NSD27002.1 S8 family peptidase [Dorea longicatena]NSD42616.1 S8 family peptidase [Dorea longicatena]NSD71649.1 S8 family peptidase [Dorea longicatena]NSD74518.1 S8 family peptidase [Dorea longicatena]